MAQGFIVVRKSGTGTVDGYWDGTSFVDSTEPDAVDSSDFIENQTDARFIQGSVQAQNVNADVAYVAASSDITIV
ncbi:hypothetical protein [Anabaena sp. PCC 7108]|uniref:hypothetical protein n=1 Tax=Anabaena sp. PCC 7108 TaxID=163908 RepID=UPI00034D5364|nr:hypothetical protein [Anabaena sp. PCC 7108]